MGLENSSELFTISVNGILYLQVSGAGLGMEGHHLGMATGGWVQKGAVRCSGSPGVVPSDSRPGRGCPGHAKCSPWSGHSQASSSDLLPPNSLSPRAPAHLSSCSALQSQHSDFLSTSF